MSAVTVTTVLSEPVPCAGSCCDCLWSCEDAGDHAPCCEYLGTESFRWTGILTAGGIDYGHVCVTVQHLGCGLFFADTTTAVSVTTGRPVTIPRVTLRYRCKAFEGGSPKGWFMETTVGDAAPVEPELGEYEPFEFLQSESALYEGGTGGTAWEITPVDVTPVLAPGLCCSCDTECECREADEDEFDPMPPEHSPFATICLDVYLGGVYTGRHALDWDEGTSTWRSRDCCPEYVVTYGDPGEEDDPGTLPRFGLNGSPGIYSHSICGLAFTVGGCEGVFGIGYGCTSAVAHVACAGCETPFQGGAYVVLDGAGGGYCAVIGPPFVLPTPPAVIGYGPVCQQPDGSSDFYPGAVGTNPTCVGLPKAPPCIDLCAGGDHFPGLAAYRPVGEPTLIGFGTVFGDPPNTGCTLSVAAVDGDRVRVAVLTFAAGTATLTFTTYDIADTGYTTPLSVTTYSGDLGDCCAGTDPLYQNDYPTGDSLPPAQDGLRPTGGTRELDLVSNTGPEAPADPPESMVVYTECCYGNGEIPDPNGSACIGPDCRRVYPPHTPEYPGTVSCAPTAPCLVRGYLCAPYGCVGPDFYTATDGVVYASLAECETGCLGVDPCALFTSGTGGDTLCITFVNYSFTNPLGPSPGPDPLGPYPSLSGDLTPNIGGTWEGVLALPDGGETGVGGTNTMGLNCSGDPATWNLTPGAPTVAVGAVVTGGIAFGPDSADGVTFDSAIITLGPCPMMAPAPRMAAAPEPAPLAPAPARKPPPKPAPRPPARVPLPLRPACKFEGAVTSFCTTCNGEAKHVRRCEHPDNEAELCTRGNPRSALWTCATCPHWEKAA